MKTCPFCAEEIQSNAIKCRHCRSCFEVKNEPEKIEPLPRETPRSPSKWPLRIVRALWAAFETFLPKKQPARFMYLCLYVIMGLAGFVLLLSPPLQLSSHKQTVPMAPITPKQLNIKALSNQDIQVIRSALCNVPRNSNYASAGGLESSCSEPAKPSASEEANFYLNEGQLLWMEGVAYGKVDNDTDSKYCRDGRLAIQSFSKAIEKDEDFLDAYYLRANVGYDVDMICDTPYDATTRQLIRKNYNKVYVRDALEVIEKKDTHFAESQRYWSLGEKYIMRYARTDIVEWRRYSEGNPKADHCFLAMMSGTFNSTPDVDEEALEYVEHEASLCNDSSKRKAIDVWLWQFNHPHAPQWHFMTPWDAQYYNSLGHPKESD